MWRDSQINDKDQESCYPYWNANRHLLQTSQLCRLVHLVGYTEWYKVYLRSDFNNKKAVQTQGQLCEAVRKSVPARFGQPLIVGGKHLGLITLKIGLSNLSLNFSEHLASTVS
jgi:hypothetical protein